MPTLLQSKWFERLGLQLVLFIDAPQDAFQVIILCHIEKLISRRYPEVEFAKIGDETARKSLDFVPGMTFDSLNASSHPTQAQCPQPAILD